MTATGDDPSLLSSWRDGPTREAIVAFVQSTTARDSPAYVPPHERIAVFDNDGTLWTEKPMPVQLDFIVRQLAEAAEQDPALRERQPYKAAHSGDLHWLGAAMVKHYQGDDSDLQTLLGAVSEMYGDIAVEDYEARVAAFFAEAEHPTLKRSYRTCGYQPMVELLRYLEANGFLTFIVSGGDRDFMRPAAEELYGIPRERVVGSSFGLDYRDDGGGGAIVYKSTLDFFDDGPQKPLHIWARVGRRPIIAGGNSNGDIPMLRFAGGNGRPALRLLVVHDDAEREVDDQGGAEDALAGGFTPISIKDDWTTVFA
jgi:phosphoserine phosphatase